MNNPLGDKEIVSGGGTRKQHLACVNALIVHLSNELNVAGAVRDGLNEGREQKKLFFEGKIGKLNGFILRCQTLREKIKSAPKTEMRECKLELDTLLEELFSKLPRLSLLLPREVANNSLDPNKYGVSKVVEPLSATDPDFKWAEDYVWVVAKDRLPAGRTDVSVRRGEGQH